MQVYRLFLTTRSRIFFCFLTMEIVGGLLADGSYHPNFRPMPMREDLTLERYALGVYNELCMALGGLVEE